MVEVNFQSSDLQIFHINIRSIRRHFDELLIFLQSKTVPIHIIVLSEVWISSEEVDKYIIPNYDLLIQERTTDASGGVIIYVSTFLSYNYFKLVFPEAEGIVLEVKSLLNNYKLNIIGLYRNCRFNFKKFRENFQGVLSNIRGPSVIVGDMNICILEKNNTVNEYLNLLYSFGYKSFLNTPTRGARCLDHVFIRDNNHLMFESSIEELDITDHSGINITCKSLLHNIPKCQYIKFIDYSLLSRRLTDQNWEPVLNCSDVNTSLASFYKIYNFCLQQSAFLKSCNSRLRKRSPWISDNLVNKINEKNKVYKAFKRDKNNLNLAAAYRQLSRFCSNQIKYEKLNFYSNKIKQCKGDTRSYWNIVKSIMKKDTQLASEYIVDGVVVAFEGNGELVANAFNQHFIDKPRQLINESFGQDMFNLPAVRRVDSDCLLSEVTAVDLINTIYKMNNKRSVGMDGISIITIKRNLTTLLPVLLHIINLSITSGIYPDLLKTSLVVPIHKSDDSKILNNYRPISLQNTLSKILENCVKIQLMKFFTQNSILSQHQYGFVVNKNTDLALERHITRIVDNVDNRKPTVGVYLDFTKAFDLVDLNFLLYKLEMTGVRGISLSWFRSFLFGRKQKVKIKNCYSETLEVNFGVPQGGVLGPILFVTFLNDLLSLSFNSSIYAFADDTSIICSENSYSILQFKLKQDLEKISNWIVNNRLLINTKKSNAVIFSYKPATVQKVKENLLFKCHSHSCLYDCNCDSIKIVNTVKYLGLYVDSDLCWRSHVDYLQKKLRRINYNLYHMRGYLTETDLRTLYISWFESTMRYGIIHWGGTYSQIIKPIVNMQKLALRTACNRRRFEPSAPLFSFLNVLRFHQLFTYAILLYTKTFSHLFSKIIIRRETRNLNSEMLQFSNYSKEISRRQCFFNCSSIYNKNHTKISLNEKMRTYKNNLKQLVKNL